MVKKFEGDFFMAKYKKKLENDIRCPLEYGLAVFGGITHYMCAIGI